MKEVGDDFKLVLLGCGRGGTNLLTGLLDYHSQLEIENELYGRAYLVGQDPRLPSTGSDLFEQRVTAFMNGCRQHIKHKPDALWGNKITTGQVFGLETHNKLNPDRQIDVLEVFFNHYLKNMKVIFILRDGRTCINSKLARSPDQPIETSTSQWQYSVTCYKFFQTRHFNNYRIRFEDLVFHPKETLQGVCDFLNVPYEEAMLLGTDNPKMNLEYRKQYFDHTKVEKTDLPEPILVQIKDDLKYCGYL